MKLRTWGIAALAACLVGSAAAPVHARRSQEQVSPPEASQQPGEPMGQHEQPGQPMPDMGQQMEEMGYSGADGYGSCDCGNCDSCGYDSGGMFGSSGMLGGLSGGRRVQVVAGAQYIYAQATFSEALAFVEQDPVNGVDTFHQYDFNFNPSYGFYGGVYLPDCGGSVLFNYTRLTSDGDFSAAATGFNNIFGAFEIDDNITGHASVDLKSYDLSFAKTIPLGCLMTGNCGDGCGDNCGDCCDDSCATGACGGGGCGGCGWCPAWDITWSGGVRFANVNWNNTVTATDPLNSSAFVDSQSTTMDFDGFGGRVGILGRRYLGKRGLFSVYGKGDFSVLFGDVDLQTAVTNVGGTAFIRTSNEITVPVTEIELGTSAHLGAHATLSAGYFWSAWHDLGMSPTYSFPQFQVSHFDDANILGFNGLFARAEVAF